jgi:alpha-galactosidase
MRDALNKTGRSIFFSMCEWGVENPALWAGSVANSWRTTDDISDSWTSFTSILDKQIGLEKYAKFGAWNDPDMLEVGNGKMTTSEYQAHFALWAALKAPLLIGCDLSKMTNDTLTILGNDELIAINQDKLGIQASRVKQEIYSTGSRDYWVGKLSGSRYVIILLNRESKPADFSLSLTRDVGLPAGCYTSLRDVITHSDIGIYHTDVLSFTGIPSHAVKAMIMTVFQDSTTLLIE